MVESMFEFLGVVQQLRQFLGVVQQLRHVSDSDLFNVIFSKERFKLFIELNWIFNI